LKLQQERFLKSYKIPHTDLIVSRLAFGCGLLGHPSNSNSAGPPSLADVKASIAQWKTEPLSADAVNQATRMIGTAIDHGITLFDLADIYSFGKAEELLGNALKNSSAVRDDVVIQTKCGIRFPQDPLDWRPGDPFRMDFSRQHIVNSADGSLRRLRTNHLDLLLLHRPDALMEPQEVAQAFDELHAAGKVRYFGVSNHTPAQMELLRKHVRQPLVVNQIHVGLAHLYPIADGIEANQDERTRITHGYTGVAGTLDYCRLNDIQIQAWSPLKGGDDSIDLLKPPADATPQVKQAAELLATLARQKAVTPAAVALAWLLRHPAGILPILGTANPLHLAESCAADQISLTREEWYDLFASAAGVPSIQLLGMVPPKWN
jgi:predicted oxidoreductase